MGEKEVLDPLNQLRCLFSKIQGAGNIWELSTVGLPDGLLNEQKEYQDNIIVDVLGNF